MASRAIWPPVVLARRQMAAVAVKKAEQSSLSSKLEVSKLPSGLTVASMDSPSLGITSLGVLVRSGSEQENNSDVLGASHAIRANVGQATENATGFSIVRSIQQTGGRLNVCATRQYTLYSLQLPRHLVGDGIDHFFEAVSCPAFKTWEQGDTVNKKMTLELGMVDRPTRAVELLHKAAYRTGLGNSLYSPDYMVGKHKSATLKEFHNKTHTLQRSVLIGHGLDHLTLNRFAQQLQLESGEGPSVTSKYVGGEQRHDCGGSQAFVAIAAESAPSSNVQEALASTLLKIVLGCGPCTLRGHGVGQLQKAVNEVTGNKAVSGINYTYSNSSLTGAFIASDAANAGLVIDAVVNKMRNVTMTDSELKAAKKALEIQIDDNLSNPATLMESIGSHLAFGSEPNTTSSGMKNLIAAISVSDVQAAAKKLSTGKLSMGACGNLGTVPYLDSL